MSEAAQTPTAASSAGRSDANWKASKGSVIVGATGALATLALAILAAMWSGPFRETGSAATPQVTSVAPRDLDGAAGTLTASVAGGLIGDAKQCRVPLAAIVIAKGSAPVGKMLRIRSGSYVSPYFTVTESPQRVAVPFPAPYGAGAGTFIVEGNATGAILSLTPTRTLLDLSGPQSIPVVWRVAPPC